MYEELGGRLNTDLSIGYNPLTWYDTFKCQVSIYFSLETSLFRAYFVMLFIIELTHLLLLLIMVIGSSRVQFRE